MQETLMRDTYQGINKTKGYYKRRLRQLEQQVQIAHQISKQTSIKTKKLKKPAKQVAKQARKIKALYIEKLQHTITQLQTKVRQLEANITKLKLTKEKHIQKNDPFGGCSHRVQREFQNLYIACKQNNSDEIQRSLCLLRDKFGINGRQRLNILNSLFDSIVKYLMPMHYRLLLDNCEENCKYYQLIAGKQQKPAIKQHFHSKQKQVLINVRPEIVSTKREYDKILRRLFEVKSSLVKHNCKCQSIVDKIEKSLSTQFVGCLLINLDSTRSFNPKYENIYPVDKWNHINEIPYQSQQNAIQQSQLISKQKQYQLFEAILDEVLQL